MMRWLVDIRGEPKDEASRMDITTKEIDIFSEEQFSEWYLCDVNPKGQVPVLGSDIAFEFPMAQTTAISEYIAERYPELLPAKHAANIHEMVHKMHEMNFFTLSFKGSPKLASGFADAGFIRLADENISDRYRKALEYKVEILHRDKVHALEPKKTEAEIQKAKAYLEEIETLLDPSSGQWLFGQKRPTELDAHLIVMIARLQDVGRDFIIPESLKAYGKKAMAEPSWVAIMEGRTTMIPVSQKIEEETIPDYVSSRYYPTRIGEIFKDRYQIVGKLGFGTSSTVWLARDMNYRRYVTIKIFIKSAYLRQQLDDELQMYNRIERGSRYHPGRSAVRSLFDSFDIDGPEVKHRCLVHPPLWESVLTFLHRNPVQRLPAPVLAFVLKRLFLALDYLHTECRIIHTDIKADNIMFGIADDSVFSDFMENELHAPSPRKELDGRTIYVSQELRMPREWGAPVLCDFDSAMLGHVEHLEDIQPNVYRAPEVILEVPWTYSVDIWDVGCMIWDVFEGGPLFTGLDPKSQTYRSQAHLAEIIKLLGPPPSSLLARGRLSHRSFSDEGMFHAEDMLTDQTPLEQRETTLEEGEDKVRFLRLMRKMLQWDPERRSSAKELQEDEWICKKLE
ncbi:protein kinase domain protein [Paecilomyces variotii No. 5]|uniref:Protein kinase domain protein n=1 Tax=Byssochlamys spectabilis (strain No. 5 / NBRC 109023) TaxID=1356009 RepID=V5FTH4_BYSSN|nr:protein kinase domain protein [Paecilomyces variotii No. 5]